MKHLAEISLNALFFFLLSYAPVFAQADSLAREEEKIRATVMDYVEGRNNGDTERLKRAFLPTASLKGVNAKQEQAIMPVADYIARNTPGKKHNCVTEINFIHFVKDVAVAHVIIRYDTHIYYDYLVMLKVQEGWRVADKFYTRQNL
jgi:hypothetical protein